MEGILAMSQKELDRLQIIKQIEKKELRVDEGADLMGISQRQTYRVLKKVREEGSKGIIHKLRGRKSNRGYPTELKIRVIGLYKAHYDDYGPTLFAEQLVENHKIPVDHETIRRWLREQSIKTSMRKRRPHRRKRQRRSCFGELLQFDGSHHDWFEGRGAECCLLNAVDDATGRVYLKFAVTENSQDVLWALWEYVKKYGIPRSIYTDRYNVYKGEYNLTDFGRAMKELDVETIYAKSAQGKGRVERVNRTLQDRLIKALRQKGISNIAEANRFLQKSFIEDYNRRFAVNTDVPDIHRQIDGYDLKNIFCYKTSRKVRNDYTINFKSGYIQLLRGKAPLPLPTQVVTICRWLNGQMHIYFNKQELKFSRVTEKPGKKEYIVRPAPKDHPWRKWNERLKSSKKRNYLAAHSG
jgi:transposase